MYKRFFEQRITRYNGQWYCFLCKTTLQSLKKAEHHSKNAHSAISIKKSSFLNTFALKNKECKKFLKHSIVIRDVQQDYYCMYCKCSIPSSKHVCQHLSGRKHNRMNKPNEKHINTNTVSEDSTNKQQNVKGDKTDDKNESVNAFNEYDSIRNLLSNFKIKENGIVSFKSYNEDSISKYYCMHCQCSIPSSEHVRQHLTGKKHKCMIKSNEKHINTNTVSEDSTSKQNVKGDMTDDKNKSVNAFNACDSIRSLLSNFKTKENGIVSFKSHNEDSISKYYCMHCQCSIPSSEHVRQHLTGKKHKCMIKSNEKHINTNTVSENSTNKQNVKDDTTDDKNESVDAFNENDSIRNLPSNFKTKENDIVSFKSHNEDSLNDDLQLEKRMADVGFCCLCDMFIYTTKIEDHIINNPKHTSIVRVLKISNQQEVYIMKFEEERKTIRAIQLNSKKFDGTTWPEYTETIIKYTCDQCKKIVEENDIINHELTVHKSDMMSSMRYLSDWWPTIKNFNIAIYYPLFRCSFCNEIIHGILSLPVHFSKRKHEKNIESLIDIKRQEYDSCKEVQTYFEPLQFLSIISFENNGGIVQIKEQPMIYIKNDYTHFFKNTIKKKSVYICFACNCTVHATCDVIDHLCKTPKHLKHFQNIFLTYKYIHDVSISEEHSMNGTQNGIESLDEVSFRKDIAIDNESLKNCNINDRQVNTEQYCNQNMTVANVSNKNDELYQNEENNSGLFMSLDILTEVNTSIKQVNSVSNKSYVEFNMWDKNSNLDRYNKTYSIEFLDFEEIMFTCNESKLNEMKLNLQFFFPKCFHSNKILCLICNSSQSYNAQAIYEHINCEKHVTRFIELNKNEKHLELLKDLIQPIGSESAKCFACNKLVRNYNNTSNNLDYKYHIDLISHKKAREQWLIQAECILEEFQNLWYKIQYFACVECNMRLNRKMRFLEHLNTVHKTVLRNKDNSVFEFCLTCATLWYKKENNANNIRISYQIHCRQKTHKYLQKSNDFAVTSLPQSLQDLLKNVNKITADLFKLSNNVLNDSKVIQLRNALKDIFETHRFSVEIHPFGSRVTGLALPNSDIDIYLDFGDEYTKPELIKSRSKQIQDCLRTDRDNWDIELTLDKSRTPIIKVKHRLTGLQCDISFMNGLSVENSKFIRSFNMACPSCQKLTLFLKKWLPLGGLTGSDGITNYALVWLVIFYLQVKFNAPSIATLIKNHNQSKIVSGWETGVGDTVPFDIPKQPIRDLLLGFFKYYGNFNYKYFVVCPLLGKIWQKRDFTEISKLSSSMAPYVAQLQNKKPEYFRIDSPMCVQDPFDLSHNLTKAVSTLTLKRFKHYCNESISVLQNITATSSKKKFRPIKSF